MCCKASSRAGPAIRNSIDGKISWFSFADSIRWEFQRCRNGSHPAILYVTLLALSSG